MAVSDLLIEAMRKKVDLSNVDLKGKRLENVHFLPGTHMAHADLSEAVLYNSSFDGVDLSEADLEKCSCAAPFRSCNLHGANLLGLIGTGRDSGAVYGQLFANCDLKAASIARCQMPRSLFVESDLDGVNFQNANLNSSCFLNCKITHADFTAAFLSRARFITSAVQFAKFDPGALSALKSLGTKASRQATVPSDFEDIMPLKGRIAKSLVLPDTHGMLMLREPIVAYYTDGSKKLMISDYAGNMQTLTTNAQTEAMAWYQRLGEKLNRVWKPLGSGTLSARLLADQSGLRVDSFIDYQAGYSRDGHAPDGSTQPLIEESIRSAVSLIAKDPEVKLPQIPCLKRIDMEIAFAGDPNGNSFGIVDE